MTTMTKPRAYSSEWRMAEPQPLPTRYGTVSIQPLGWGIRVESEKNRPEEVLTINGVACRLAWADFIYDEDQGEWVYQSDGLHLKKAASLFALDDARQGRLQR